MWFLFINPNITKYILVFKKNPLTFFSFSFQCISMHVNRNYEKKIQYNNSNNFCEILCTFTRSLNLNSICCTHLLTINRALIILLQTPLNGIQETLPCTQLSPSASRDDLRLSWALLTTNELWSQTQEIWTLATAKVRGLTDTFAPKIFTANKCS